MRLSRLRHTADPLVRLGWWNRHRTLAYSHVIASILQHLQRTHILDALMPFRFLHAGAWEQQNDGRYLLLLLLSLMCCDPSYQRCVLLRFVFFKLIFISRPINAPEDALFRR